MKMFLVPVVAALLGMAVEAAAPAPQAGDVSRVLANTRAALGGAEKLAAVKTFAATGRSTRVVDGASQEPTDVETAFELPDKFMKKEALALPMMPAGGAITHTTGFNGDTPIEIVDRPPSMPGNVVIRLGPDGGAPGTRTPEQEQEARRQQVIGGKQELARLTLGILASSLDTYPLQFSLAGQAESPDGKADIVEVKGEGDFAARLFIDASTHLPLMLAWMEKEPLMIRRTMGPGPGRGGPGHASISPEERDKLRQGLEEERRQAEQKRRTVEFRLYYSDYRDVNGVKVPFTIRQSIDGKPAEEVAFEKVKINGKIDPKKFETK